MRILQLFLFALPPTSRFVSRFSDDDEDCPLIDVDETELSSGNRVIGIVLIDFLKSAGETSLTFLLRDGDLVARDRCLSLLGLTSNSSSSSRGNSCESKSKSSSSGIIPSWSRIANACLMADLSSYTLFDGTMFELLYYAVV